MNKRVKNLWVEALLSGKYRQGRGSLNKDNFQFCCLGVLCEVAIEDGVSINKEKSQREIVYDKYADILPFSVKEWAELNSQIGRIDAYTDSLINLNDSGKSFKYIAEFIEKNWEQL